MKLRHLSYFILNFLLLLLTTILFHFQNTFAEETSSALKSIEIGTHEQCHCSTNPTLESAYELAQIVFSGSVVERKILSYRSADGNFLTRAEKITIDIEKIWKGSLQRRIDLFHLIEENSEKPVEKCDFPFEIGKEYLVYADTSSFDTYRTHYTPPGIHFLYATQCGRTKKLSAAIEEMELLGIGRIPE
jgi:hypothetical protein